jgi:outer membrane protein assembly factor BamB
VGGIGMRRIGVTSRQGEWMVEERWTSRGPKPYFNDFVVSGGYAFFDGSILACIDLRDGERKCKGGRYGHGQMVLLSDQRVLLVLSEDGELALVGDVVLVRNSEEMAAFRLPHLGSRSPTPTP